MNLFKNGIDLAGWTTLILVTLGHFSALAFVSSTPPAKPPHIPFFDPPTVTEPGPPAPRPAGKLLIFDDGITNGVLAVIFGENGEDYYRLFLSGQSNKYQTLSKEEYQGMRSKNQLTPFTRESLLSLHLSAFIFNDGSIGFFNRIQTHTDYILMESFHGVGELGSFTSYNFNNLRPDFIDLFKVIVNRHDRKIKPEEAPATLNLLQPADLVKVQRRQRLRSFGQDQGYWPTDIRLLVFLRKEGSDFYFWDSNENQSVKFNEADFQQDESSNKGRGYYRFDWVARFKSDEPHIARQFYKTVPESEWREKQTLPCADVFQ